MKFKTGDSGAPQNSVKAMYDIRSLELACASGYDAGRFLMATENKYNWQEPRSSEIRETFGIYQGRTVEPGDELKATTQTARGALGERERLRMEGSYEFDWDNIGMDFRFLSVPVG
jgi:hypothetical protein